MAQRVKDLQDKLQQKEKQYAEVMKTIQDADPEEWQASRELIKETAVIAVMGATGAGKSSLIGALGGKAVATLDSPVVGHGGDSGEYILVISISYLTSSTSDERNQSIRYVA
jgi:tRNA U34 5-carboxymethylaminomethyl modifying GTPase MnmE/TrmE